MEKLHIIFGGASVEHDVSIITALQTYNALKDKCDIGLIYCSRDNKFFLYKRQPVEIPIEDIFKISIHDGDGSFDILVKTSSQKYSMHCFIKEQRKKKNELIFLLKIKGIKVDTFVISGGE